MDAWLATLSSQSAMCFVSVNRTDVAYAYCLSIPDVVYDECNTEYS